MRACAGSKVVGAASRRQRERWGHWAGEEETNGGASTNHQPVTATQPRRLLGGGASWWEQAVPEVRGVAGASREQPGRPAVTGEIQAAGLAVQYLVRHLRARTPFCARAPTMPWTGYSSKEPKMEPLTRRHAAVFVVPMIVGLVTAQQAVHHVRTVDFLVLFASGVIFGVSPMGLIQVLRATSRRPGAWSASSAAGPARASRPMTCSLRWTKSMTPCGGCGAWPF